MFCIAYSFGSRQFAAACVPLESEPAGAPFDYRALLTRGRDAPSRPDGDRFTQLRELLI